MRRRPLPWLLIASMAVSRLASLAAAQIPEVVAAPGSVVLWPGGEIESCELDGERSLPLADACWFALDLLETRDELEVRRWRGGVRETGRIRVADYPYPVQRITIEDDSKVNLSAADLARVRSEQSRVAGLWRSRDSARFTLPLASPLRDRGRAGRFGARRFFNDQPRSPHTGADYAAAEGTPVFSAAAGRVVLADDLFFSGHSVFVDHGDGLVSMYFHLRDLLVAEGDEIGRGEIVGRVGQTGRATGPHLHFGLRWRGCRIDPEQLLAIQSVAVIR